MPLAAKLFSMAVIFALTGASASPCRLPLEGIGRALVRAGHGRACPSLQEQELPGWLKALAIAALLVALAVFALAAALL